MTEKIFVNVNKVITKEVMLQYEFVRQSGKCNMLDRFCVQRTANDFELYELVLVCESQKYYSYILQNFSNLMQLFEINQNERLTAEDVGAAEFDEDDEEFEDEEEWEEFDEEDENDEEWEDEEFNDED